jgi:acetoin utilization deacetylase AcuC-like enzyme
MPTRLYVDPRAEAHVTGPGHPERQARIQACLDALEEAELETERVETAPAARADLERIHPARYLDKLEAVCRRGGGPLDPDTFAGPDSFDIAVRAAGAGVDAVRLALDEGIRSFCLVRPPGHHATATRPMGFCLVNNVAVAAASALHRGLERVAVVDFDVHHGNGTQDVFWGEPRVLYVSMHQYPWYPWYVGALEEIGEGDGEGSTVNVPLPAGSGDAAYLAAVDRVVGPVVRRFDPGLLLVSAGYDAHTRDPLSSMELTTRGFGAIAARLVALAADVCDGRILMTLEGGYDLEGLSTSFVATLRALDGEELPLLGGPDLDPGSAAELDRIAAFHGDRWGTS